MQAKSPYIIIGSGIAGLAVASLLSRDAFPVTVLEQNWLPGGCMSSYPRKGYIFEAGATTLVGLEKNMPLGHLLDELGIELDAWELEIPMKVLLKDGTEITRYHDLEDWITEAERVFGKKNQRAFWEYCFKVSQFVWDTSLKQKAFPPSSFSDLLSAAKNFEFKQLGFARLAFQSMEGLLGKYDLLDNEPFVDFVNEQLLITAQNYLKEVNVLFGATALCYTNYKNYYVEGGLIKVADLLVDYIRERGGEVQLRKPVEKLTYHNGFYEVESVYRGKQESFSAKSLISAIPLNNTLKLFRGSELEKKHKGKLMKSDQLNSAFTMGIVFPRKKKFDCIHYQIHLKEALPQINTDSIFLSLSHPDDQLRCGMNEYVASISTHIPDPSNHVIEDKSEIEAAIIAALSEQGFLDADEIIFSHSSTAGAWEKWTARSWGFVGGYPQYMSIKPWQMMDARLDHKRAYICGDSTYPGQGIPGACLSGIIAYEKITLDQKKPLEALGIIRKSL
ncbi:MAG: NAD(P)/FAD-dependent oxidoreductase [Bacteroidia bacterium]|nr:NAD(P)/FAD-dependent oxidoreductase [Bacteroidia bacterium]